MIKLRKIALVGTALLFAAPMFAGNPDRIGQAGAPELKINPWARSSGWAGANSAYATGLEATSLNVAGLAFTRKTEVMFVNTNWLVGSDVSINSFGLSQRVGEQSVLGLGVMSVNYGDIEITTVDLPEGGQGNFSPKALNLGLSYAREFSNSIYGGMTIRSVSQSIADARAGGMAIDAGIRYITGKYDNVKFGIALRNIGPPMQFEGDGFSTKVTLDGNEFTLEQRTAPFELPALLNIGFSYDFFLGTKAPAAPAASTAAGGTDGEEAATATEGSTNPKTLSSDHVLTAAGNFTSNSFGKDQIRVGLQYGFKDYIQLRAGYVYEEGVFKPETRTSAFSGPTAGLSVLLPLNQNGSRASFDYSYRVTENFSGTHAIGVRLDL